MTSERTARTLALFVIALVVGLSIRHNTFAAWATDSGAYISAGYAWARGELFTPATFVFWAPWASDGFVEFPLGHVQGPIKGTITGQYPLGYPLLIGAALRIVDSPLAPHLVSPILAGVLAWCAFVLGRRMATGWAGLLAAFMIGSTPVVLGHAVVPFSDVPAAAFWAIAWVMSVRPGHGAALASGAAAAMAVMIRPNIAPLAVVIAATVFFAERRTWGHAFIKLLAFGATGVIGPLLVLWSQAELYGHPLQSGYRVPMDHFFSLARVPYNAGLYPRMLAELHTWVAFGGLLHAPFALRRMRANDAAYTRGVLTVSALALIVVNYVLYLPYLTYVGWYWLRFLLPALLAMFVLLAAGLDQLRLALRHRWPKLAYVALAPVLIVFAPAEKHILPPVGYERIPMTERYLAEALPANAVILTYSHGGAWMNATGRPVLRLDVLPGDRLDEVVASLQRRGYRPVYVFDVAIEGDFFADRFRVARLGRLTWPARAEFSSSTSVVYYDISDRDKFFSGERWSTDVLVGGRSDRGLVAWSDLRVEHERIILPTLQETNAFRTVLEPIYRDHLSRPASTIAVPPAESVSWLQRYVRLRLHGCSHESASSRLLNQLEKGEPAALCSRPDAVFFPPEDESMEFRRVIEERLAARGSNRARRVTRTHVDALGEVVWTQRYLGARVSGCSHGDAVANISAQITGATPRACASPDAGPASGN